MANITISRDRLNEVTEAMCEDYCYFAVIGSDQDVLKRHCDDCPLNNILVEEYPLGRNDWQE